VASRTVEVATRKASAKDTDLVEVRRGRIRMLRQSRSKARSMAQALPGENCASYCEDCTSQCEVCMSGCTCY
jgi:ribonucleotide reductase alpha subunit